MTVVDQLEMLLATPVRSCDDLGASHAWTLHRAVLADGSTVFAKASATPNPALTAESAGLTWLGESLEGSGSSHGARLLPKVVAADERMLVLPWLTETAPTAVSATALGRELAGLHRNSPPHFGAPWPGRIADLPLDNTPTDEPWSHWYAERRLVPYLSAAADHLGQDGIDLLHKVIERIDTLSGPPEPPARLHGDLWAGNVVWTEQGGVLIDPAAHGGHRETDLAMLALFGAPHLDRILAAYDEQYPLADGWRARIPLHQLHPLLVHVALYGSAYRASTLTAARAALEV
ncbi:fructosamine kinase family protein [Nocardia callitridis]|uniref:Fructosamine kinase family protein n=1 Tax=Nocardia callitridis TaxID=648753 RepID=A0ABP9K5T6_9NOCA